MDPKLEKKVKEKVDQCLIEINKLEQELAQIEQDILIADYIYKNTQLVINKAEKSTQNGVQLENNNHNNIINNYNNCEYYSDNQYEYQSNNIKQNEDNNVNNNVDNHIISNKNIETVTTVKDETKIEIVKLNRNDYHKLQQEIDQILSSDQKNVNENKEQEQQEQQLRQNLSQSFSNQLKLTNNEDNELVKIFQNKQDLLNLELVKVLFMIKNNKVYLRKDESKLNIPFFKKMNFKECFDKLSDKVLEVIQQVIQDKDLSTNNQKIQMRPVLVKLIEILSNLISNKYQS